MVGTQVVQTALRQSDGNTLCIFAPGRVRSAGLNTDSWA